MALDVVYIRSSSALQFVCTQTLIGCIYRTKNYSEIRTPLERKTHSIKISHNKSIDLSTVRYSSNTYEICLSDLDVGSKTMTGGTLCSFFILRTSSYTQNLKNQIFRPPINSRPPAHTLQGPHWRGWDYTTGYQ